MIFLHSLFFPVLLCFFSSLPLSRFAALAAIHNHSIHLVQQHLRFSCIFIPRLGAAAQQKAPQNRLFGSLSGRE
jgi:hypothetical protein